MRHSRREYAGRHFSSEEQCAQRLRRDALSAGAHEEILLTIPDHLVTLRIDHIGNSSLEPSIAVTRIRARIMSVVLPSYDIGTFGQDLSITGCEGCSRSTLKSRPDPVEKFCTVVTTSG